MAQWLSSKRSVAAFAIVLLAATAGCSDDDENTNNTANNNVADATNNTSPDATSPDATADGGPRADGTSPGGCTTTIEPTDDAEQNRVNITQALVEPADGDVICLSDGTYPLTSQLQLNASDVSDIEIRGESQDGTVLDFDGQQEGSNGLLIDGVDDIRVADFTIKNTAGDAIKIQNADGVEMVNLTVTWDGGPQTDNGAYGVYPVLDQNVLIEGCTVSYAADAGIYVGQTDTVIARDNEAFGNVAGLEIENTSHADVYNNNLHDNTGGLLVFNLPDLEVRDGSDNKIHDNVIENNNQSNFAASGSIVALVPAGTGLFLLSTDNNEVHDNTLAGNDSTGIVVVSYLLTGETVTDDQYDAYSESNYIHDNTFDANGAAPTGLAAVINRGGDVPALAVDGYLDPDYPADQSFEDIRNCFEDNQLASGDPADFINFDAQSSFDPPEATDCSDTWTDFCHLQCTGQTLPAVTLE